MRRVWSWVRDHDLVAFPVLAFGLGWLFYVPAMVLISGRPERFGWLIFFQTPGAGMALVAGWIVRHARGGAAEVADGWRRYLDAKGHPWWWWAAAVALVPSLAVAAGLVRGSFGDGVAQMWGQIGWFTLLALVPIGAMQLISSPLLEEYGWRGFWQPRLQHRWAALPASVLVGVLWGVHHLPIALAVGADPWTTVVGAVGPSVLAAWLLNAGRGSMVGPMLLHAGLNLAMDMLAPAGWAFPVAMLVAAAVVAVVAGPVQLGGRPRVSLAPTPARRAPDAGS